MATTDDCLFSAFTTLRLVRVLQRSYRKRKQLVTQSSKSREDITLSLVVVVITYIVCQVPNPVRTILELTNIDRSCGSFYFIFSTLSIDFAMLNSAINFVILACCSLRFRLRVKRMLCGWVLRGKVAPGLPMETVTEGARKTTRLEIPNRTGDLRPQASSTVNLPITEPEV